MANYRELINQAITSNGKVKITYRDYHGRITTRTIEPKQWEGYDKFLAFCHLRNENRHFRIFNIVSCESLSSTVENISYSSLKKPSFSNWKSTNMDLVYQSKFGKGEEGWYTGQGDHYKFTLGEGKFTARVTGSNVWNATWKQFEPLKRKFPEKFEIEVNTQFTSPNIYWASLGLVFNQQRPKSHNDSDFCLFAITNTGYYGFYTYFDNLWSEIIPWTISDKIKKGFQINKLHIKQEESQITIGVNNFEFASLWFDQFSGHGIGFYIQSGDNSPYAEANFSNLCFYHGNKGIIFSQHENKDHKLSASKTPRLSKLIIENGNFESPTEIPIQYEMNMEGAYLLPGRSMREGQFMIGWGRIIDHYFLPENKILVIARERSGVIDQETKKILWQIVWSSHDGKLNPTFTLLALVKYSTIYLINLTQGKFIEELSTHESMIAILEFSPNGNFLVSVDVQGTIIIWDLIDLSKIKKTVLADAEINPTADSSIEFDPNNKYMLMKIRKKTLVYSLENKQVILQLIDDSKWNYRMVESTFHPNLELLCYTRNGGSIHFYDLINNQELAKLEINTQIEPEDKQSDYYYGEIKISPYGKYLLANFSGKIFHIFDLTTGNEIAYIDRKDGYLQNVKLITIDPNSDIVIITWDGGYVYGGRHVDYVATKTIINVWKFSDGKFIFEKEISHKSPAHKPDIYFDSDTEKIVIDKILFLTKDGKEIKTDFYLGEGPINDFEFSPDGSKLFISDRDHIKVIDLTSHKTIDSHSCKDGFEYIKITNDGKLLATIRDNKIAFLEIGNWTTIRQTNISCHDHFALSKNNQDIFTLGGHFVGDGDYEKVLVKNYCNSIAMKKEDIYTATHSFDDIIFSPCNKYFIETNNRFISNKYGGELEYPAVFSLITGEIIMEIPKGICKFNHQGKVSILSDGQLTIIDPENKRTNEYKIKFLKKDSIFDLSPDCKILALFKDPSLILVDVKSGEEIEILELSNTNVKDMTFCPNLKSILIELKSEAYLLLNI